MNSIDKQFIKRYNMYIIQEWCFNSEELNMWLRIQNIKKYLKKMQKYSLHHVNILLQYGENFFLRKRFQN